MTYWHSEQYPNREDDPEDRAAALRRDIGDLSMRALEGEDVSEQLADAEGALDSVHKIDDSGNS